MDVLNGASLLIMGGIPDPLSVNRVQAKSGPLKVGSATSGHALTGATDLLVAGKLEVDGTTYLDENVVITGNASSGSALTVTAAGSGHLGVYLNGPSTNDSLIFFQKAGVNKARIGLQSGTNDFAVQNGAGTVDIVRLVDSGDIQFKPSGMANASEIGQGDTDTDISYIALRNASGALCYIYPNATGDGIVVSTTKP